MRFYLVALNDRTLERGEEHRERVEFLHTCGLLGSVPTVSISFATHFVGEEEARHALAQLIADDTNVRGEVWKVERI